MKLYIMFFSLKVRLYDESEYLQSVLSLNDGNCWYIETNDTSEIENLKVEELNITSNDIEHTIGSLYVSELLKQLTTCRRH